MRCFFFLPVVLLSFASAAQETNVFEKANTIIIETRLNPDSIFIAWGRHLAQSGYIIDKSDKDFLSLTTGPKDLDQINIDYIVVSAVDAKGRIKITIRWRTKSFPMTHTRATDYDRWSYRNSKLSSAPQIHNDFVKVAKRFGTFEILYSIE